MLVNCDFFSFFFLFFFISFCVKLSTMNIIIIFHYKCIYGLPACEIHAINFKRETDPNNTLGRLEVKSFRVSNHANFETELFTEVNLNSTRSNC